MQPVHESRRASARVVMALAGLAVIGLAAAAGMLTGRLMKPQATQAADPDAGGQYVPQLFAGWAKPDVAIVLSGEMHGYLLPCGCSRPQKGGLERRYNFIQGLKERGWPVMAVDLGDLPQNKGPRDDLPNVQGLIKYVTAMKALKATDYTAIGIGRFERLLPLTKAMDEYAQNEKKPRVVAANLMNKGDNQDFGDEIGNGDIVEFGPLKVGVVGVEGRALVKEEIGDQKWVKFEDEEPAIKRALTHLAEKKVDVRVLLYQGKLNEAKRCAEAFPAFQLILCLDDSDEPPSLPIIAGETTIVTVGHKGKNIGVVGVYRTPAAKFQLKYQLVEMTENYETPKGKEASNPVLKIMEEYTARLKREDYLRQYRQNLHPLQQEIVNRKKDVPEYIGTEQCRSCHESAYQVWKKTPHAHAYQTLVDAKRPSLRQYDPECIICHVTGFGYKTGFIDEKEPNFKKLIDVGCEVCHGPAGAHLDDPNDAKIYPLMNPWKPRMGENDADKNRRLLQINSMCMKCHDLDNDVHWSFDKFKKENWPKIEHHTPAKKP